MSVVDDLYRTREEIKAKQERFEYLWASLMSELCVIAKGTDGIEVAEYSLCGVADETNAMNIVIEDGKFARVIVELCSTVGNQVKLASEIDGVVISATMWHVEDAIKFFKAIVKSLQN